MLADARPDDPVMAAAAAAAAGAERGGADPPSAQSGAASAASVRVPPVALPDGFRDALLETLVDVARAERPPSPGGAAVDEV